MVGKGVISAFTNLYKKFPLLSKFNFDSKYVKYAMGKDMELWKVCRRRDLTDKFFYLYDLTPAMVFPLSFFDRFNGFVVRSLEGKDFRTLLYRRPIFYTSKRSFDEFRNRKLNFVNPFLLAEGVFDAEALSIFSSFAFAVCSSNLTKNQAWYISYFADEVYYFPDSDDAGKKGARIIKKRLARYKVSVNIVNLQIHDPGTLLELKLNNEKGFDYWVSFVKSCIL